MGCIFRPRCNHLWSVWYCFFVVTLHAYMLYLGIHRYILYEDLQWRFGTKPTAYLYIYIGLHGLVIALLPFFIAFALFKTGNIASDNEVLGGRPERVIELRGRSCCPKRCKSFWQHGPPAAQTIHLMMAFALLIAEQLIFAHYLNQDYKDIERTDIIESSKDFNVAQRHFEDLFWSTDLDFIYNPRAGLATIPEHGKHPYNIPEEDYMSYQDTGRSQIWQKSNYRDYMKHKLDPKIIPIIASQKLFGISIDFFNYFLALAIFAVSYPAVLWRASKWFSFLFSFHLMLHAFAAIFNFISFSMLYRLQILNPRRSGNFGDKMNVLKDTFLLPNSYFVLGAYLSGILAMYLASAVLYSYGYTRYCMCWILQSQKRNRQDPTANAIGNGKKVPDPAAGCCEGYCPHMLAIVLLMWMVAAKIMLLYDVMLIFLNPNQPDKKPLALSCIIADVAYLFLWIFLWLFLTCKRRWEFNVSYSIEDLICLLHADRSGPGVRKIPASEIRNPDNAMLLMTNEELYVTDDTTKKAAILRQAHKYGLGSPKDEVYWLKPNGPSPTDPRMTISAAPDYKRNDDLTDPPEGTRLLKGKPELENEYSIATSPQLGDRNQQFYKVSFDDGQQIQMAGKPPLGSRQQLPQQQQQQHPMTAASSRGGSYMRFAEMEAANNQYGYDEHAHDVVTTFGTLPRGENKRRRILQGSDADFQYPQYGQNFSSRQPSETGSVTYASIHKSRPSPAPSSGQQSRDCRFGQQVGDVESNASRGSSYVNLPSSQQKQPFNIRNSSWDSNAGRNPPGPPQARVIPTTAPGYVRPGQRQESISQQSTPLSPRAQRFQNQYATINGTPSNPEAAVSTDIYQTYGGNQMAQLTRVRQSPGSENPPTSIGQTSSNPYDPHTQRTGLKMSSFSDISKAGQPDPLVALLGGPATSTGIGRDLSREMTPQSNASSTLNNRYGTSLAQPQHVHWHANPMYGHEANTDDNPNYTPSSTLTSHGSYTLTPTPSSPPGSSISSTNQSNTGVPPPMTNGNGHGIMGRKASGGSFGTGAQNVISNSRAPGINGYSSKGHNRNDSANYSLTSSSNESGEQTGTQFATSIV